MPSQPNDMKVCTSKTAACWNLAGKQEMVHSLASSSTLSQKPSPSRSLLLPADETPCNLGKAGVSVGPFEVKVPEGVANQPTAMIVKASSPHRWRCQQSFLNLICILAPPARLRMSSKFPFPARTILRMRVPAWEQWIFQGRSRNQT